MTCTKTTCLFDFRHFHSSVFLSLLLGHGIWSFAIIDTKNINNPLYHHWFLVRFLTYIVWHCRFYYPSFQFSKSLLRVRTWPEKKPKKSNQQSHIMIEPLFSFNKWFIVLSLKIGKTLFPCYEPCICSPFPSPRSKLIHSNVLYDNTP